ncbi:MAG TPA: DUF11 domain-containing protein, partial [Nakamurella sp.]
NLANDSAAVGVTGQQADIGVAVTASTATPSYGAGVTLTVVAQNLGPSTATGVSVTDLLPAGLSLGSAVPGQGAYDPVTGAWTVGTLAPGASATLVLNVFVNTTAPVTDTTTQAAVDQPDPNPANDSASTTLTPVAADIALTGSVSNATPNEGSNVTYTIAASNLGPSGATGVQVTAALPGGLAYVSSSATAGAYDPVTGLWNLGSAANASTATLTLTATVKSGATQTLTAFKSAENEPDPVAANNAASASVTGVPQADVAVTQTTSTFTADWMSTFTVTVIATNSGPSPATGLQVTEILPAGFTFKSATPPAGTGYDTASGLWTVGTLASGQSVSMPIQLIASGIGIFPVTARKSAENEHDPNLANDTSTLDIDPNLNDLQLTIAADTTSPVIGQQVSYLLTLRNLGPTDAAGVIVTDQLPTGLAFADASAGGGLYDPATGAWTVGSLANGATVTLRISAIVGASGQLLNSAAVTSSRYPDPNPANNSAAISVTPTAVPGFGNDGAGGILPLVIQTLLLATGLFGVLLLVAIAHRRRRRQD